MSFGVKRSPLVSPEEYLAEELSAESKHEYVSGMVYARLGETVGHSRLATNIVATLHGRLRGRSYQVYGSDLLVEINQGSERRFYYSDAAIHGDSIDPNARTIDSPVVVFEVFSDLTVRVDTGEKRLGYLSIPSLEAYVLVNSECREVVIWRQRAGKWGPEALKEPAAVLEFASAGCSLTVGEIYGGTGL